jgi:hypothetical protein
MPQAEAVTEGGSTPFGAERDPIAASVLAEAFRDGHGQSTAVVFHGIAFELAAILFNIIWWHARRDRRLLATTIDSAGVRAIGRRFQLALAWIAAFIPYYWLPIAGEIAKARRRRVRPRT